MSAGGLKHPEWKLEVSLVFCPGFFLTVGIVVIRDFIVREVVRGDETCFTPTFATLFSP